jgi:hypothetical protein
MCCIYIVRFIIIIIIIIISGLKTVFFMQSVSQCISYEPKHLLRVSAISVNPTHCIVEVLKAMPPLLNPASILAPLLDWDSFRITAH